MSEEVKRLLERVEAASGEHGADEDLRKDILLAIDPQYAKLDRVNIGGGKQILRDVEDAMILVEEALPNRDYMLAKNGDRYQAGVAKKDGASVWLNSSSYPNAALALLAALLRAKLADPSPILTERSS